MGKKFKGQQGLNQGLNQGHNQGQGYNQGAIQQGNKNPMLDKHIGEKRLDEKSKQFNQTQGNKKPWDKNLQNKGKNCGDNC